MTKSQLPHVLEHQSDACSASWRLQIAADHPAFAGHFPDHPILPGVVQLDWAVRMGCQQFGYPLAIAQIEVLKFQQLIVPNTQVTLTIKHDVAKQKLQFSLTDGERRFASGRIAFGTEANP
ncbi:thioester dehydrase [Shewanella mangrovi]|uniref:Thioester dehydrase n=1 Tax=Shewanella mangrovi TaxID=1515746 RepID=A0A094JZ33_9GAMM|nr:thioester dehydrase [Shewanella mangrovi]KFZ37701.1 thioester dehydrase [Shewanella mangrovi]